MTQYDYICPCGAILTVSCRMGEAPEKPKCECGNAMGRVYSAQICADPWLYKEGNKVSMDRGAERSIRDADSKAYAKTWANTPERVKSPDMAELFNKVRNVQ